MSYSGSGLIIMSLLVLYLLSGSTSFTSLKGLTLDPTTQYLLMLLLTVGFGIKAALVPMHNWLPDAHPEAPSNVSALLSGFMIKTAVYGMLRFAVDLLRLDYYGVRVDTSIVRCYISCLRYFNGFTSDRF
jgi:hydrogenase-4 component B